jgi:hypothetical protein
MPTNATLTTLNSSEAGTVPEPEPEPEPYSWLDLDVNFGALLPSSAGTPINIGGEGDSSNATACWTGQQFQVLTESNLAVGSQVEAIPPGDVSSGTLVDNNLDRNWHSSDDLGDDSQIVRLTLPGPPGALYCISGVKLYWRNVYSARHYVVNSSTDGVHYTNDILNGAGYNRGAALGRIDEYSFPLHDGKQVQFTFLERQQQMTLDYDLLEIEVYGIAGKCNATFENEPAVTTASQLQMIQLINQQNLDGNSASASTELSWWVPEDCSPMAGMPQIDVNGGRCALYTGATAPTRSMSVYVT